MLTTQEQNKINFLHREQVENMLNSLLAPVLKSKACQYELTAGGWLTVEYQAPLNNAPASQQDYKYYLLFALNIFEATLPEIQNKLFIMLFEHLRSLKQDINGLFIDYKLIRK